MGRFRTGIVIAAAVLAALPYAASAQGTSDGALQVWNPVLASSIERLSAQSASWRDAITAVAATGRRALVITPDQIKTPIEADTLAQVFPLADERSHVETVLVVINITLLHQLSGLPATAIDFEGDVDRILAHEVYGHAIPLLLSGARCADPAAGQSALASCAIQRENVIRREMRLGQRFEYGRDGLASTRRGWR